MCAAPSRTEMPSSCFTNGIRAASRRVHTSAAPNAIADGGGAATAAESFAAAFS